MNATDKQIAFLTSLLTDRVHDFDQGYAAQIQQWITEGALTKPVASELISTLLQFPKRQRAESCSAVPEDGWYIDGDDIICVKWNRERTNRYAMRLVVHEGNAEYEYAAGLIHKMGSARKLTVDEAAAFGKLYGVCAICGRTLTNPESIERGIGPICAGKVG